MTRIEKVLSDSEMLESQRKTLEAFDRFNELECQCRLSTRLGYILAVLGLELSIRKLFKEIKKGRLAYVSQLKQNHTISCVKTFQTLLKRFLRWLEMVKTDEALPDEEKVEMTDVRLPHGVKWIKEVSLRQKLV